MIRYRGTSGLFAVLVAAWVACCVDTVPKPYKGTGANAGLADAQPFDGSVLSTCRECIMGEGGACRSEYEACLAVPKCKELIDCGLETGCLVLPTLEERVACAKPCFTSVGIVTTTDPGLGAGLQINACTLGPCASECGGK